MPAGRDSRYDFYKGILMMGVVWGHVINALEYGSALNIWIHVFFRMYDMPMFAFITGYFLKRSITRHHFAENISNKIGMLLIPAVFWDLVISLYARRIVIGATGLWYLWGSFFAVILILFAEKLSRNNRKLEFAFLCTALLLTHVGFLEKWNTGFLLFPMICGYCSEKMKERLNPEFRKPLMNMIFAFFIILQFLWKTDYTVWNAGCNIIASGGVYIPAIMIRGITGVISALAMMTLFEKLYYIMSNSSNRTAVNVQQGLIKCGSITLELYVLQDLFVVRIGSKAVKFISAYIGYNPFVLHASVSGMILAPMIAIASLIILYYVQRILKRIPVIKYVAFGISPKSLNYKHIKSI